MDNLKETVNSVAKILVRTTSELFKTTKQRVTLVNEESHLKSIYESIGKRVHEMCARGESLGEYFDGKYAEIQKCEARISDIKARIEQIKNSDEATAAAEQRFVPETVAVQAEPDAKICPACSSANGAEEKFCVHCGRLL